MSLRPSMAGSEQIALGKKRRCDLPKSSVIPSN
jgi:hypothetical protein